VLKVEMSSLDSLSNSIVVISDLIELRSNHPACNEVDAAFAMPHHEEIPVTGGYLERLPLAAVSSGLALRAEIWHHHRGEHITSHQDTSGITRRAFPINDDRMPMDSDSIVRFLEHHGPPKILCVWGLGVSERILEACRGSFIIYNSIDVPALRVPVEVSRHFDLVLTGADWQSEIIRERHPEMPTAVLPIGPEFASPHTFYPIACPKIYDVVYVAAAQPYKRHDVLFDALARSLRPLSALCVMGYGEDGDRLRQQATAMGIAVDFVGPPGVTYSEVNRLMNQARVGVVCGVDDGAPAILTEYMLAGLPVVANADLRCGLQYILPQTGVIAPGDALERGIVEALGRTDFKPRQTVLERWSWRHSIAVLMTLVQPSGGARRAALSPERMKA
jgi:glycosyltransferase involved in cell wall biosynthesis